MPTANDTSRVMAAVDERRLLELERKSIRIPSTTFEEGKIADFYANYLSEIGLDVEMMDVIHPFDRGHQEPPADRPAQGPGGGPTLMLNGHMDPGCEMTGWSVDPYGAKFEDGWIWGMGAHDDKGGVVAAISAVEAIVRSGTRLKGDVLVTPVIAHKLGGAGTRALLRHGVKADLCINMEHSNNTIANVCVGVVMVRFICSTPDLFFRYSAEARAAFMNAIEQQMAIVQRIGPSLTPIPQGGWMPFEPHPELPGFPALTYDVFHREHYYYKNYTGHSTRDAEMTMQFRTVPGQTVASIEADLRHVLGRHQARAPRLQLRHGDPRQGHRADLEPGGHGVSRRPSAGEGAGRGTDACLWQARLRRRPRPHRQCRRRQRHPGGAGHPDRAVRAGRHPHLQGMADARRARAALGPGDGGQGRGPRDRQAMWMNHSRAEVPLCETQFHRRRP